MKIKLSFLIGLLFLCSSAFAQTQPSVRQSGSITAGHLATWSANQVIQDGGAVPSTTVNLGTSTASANPQISGDATSGLYTAGAGLVDVVISGTKRVEWASTGETVVGSLTGNSFIPNSSTIPTDGLYLPAANTSGIADNSQPVAEFSGVSSAVDFLQVTNAATANPATVTLATAGTDTNINLALTAQGTGSITTSFPVAVTSTSANALAIGTSGTTNPILLVDDSTASVKSGITIKGAVGGGTVTITDNDPSSTTSAQLNLVGPTGGGGNGTVGLVASGNRVLAVDGGTTGRNVVITLPNQSFNASTKFQLVSPSSDANLTASTEAILATFGSTVTRSHAAGALTTQRDFVFTGATDSFGSASTLTDGATVSLVYKKCGSNGTCTNESALYIPTLAITGTVTNSYGLKVAAATGATNNMAAAFTGGPVLIGTTTPTANVSLALNSNTDSMTLPVGTTGQRPATGVSGMVRYNSTTPDFEGYFNGTWNSFDVTPAATGYIYNPGNDALPKWRTALQNVKNGVQNAHILWIGTSTVGGYCSTFQSWLQTNTLEALQASYLQNAYGFNANNDNIFGYPASDGTARTTADTRMVVNAGWGQDTVYSIGGPMFVNTTTTNTIDFTAPTTADTAKIYYPTDNSGTPTLGTISYAVNAAAATNINEGASAPAVATTTISITPGSNVIHIARVSGTAKFIGIEFYLSTSKTVNIINSGVGGIVAGTWIDASGKAYATPAAFSAVNPDLSIILMDNNDAIANTASATYKSNMQSIINNLSNGDTVLSAQTAYGAGAGTVSNITAKITDLQSLATTNSVPFLNNYQRTVSYPYFTSQGMTCEDDLHPDYLGYQDTAWFHTTQIQLLAGNDIPVNTQVNGLNGGGGTTGLVTMPTATATGIGWQASMNANLAANIGTDTESTSLGAQANQYPLGVFNVAVGYQAVQGNSGTTTANRNVGVGTFALNAVTSGANNVGIGMTTGNLVTTGSTNTLLGNHVASTTLTTGSNDIIIGVSSACDASSSSASNELHICGTAGDSIKMTGMGTLASEATTIRGTLTLTDIASDATHTDATVCEDTTSHTLFRGSGTAGICLGTSSLRYKHDIHPMVTGLSEIEQLKPINFYYNKGYGDEGAKQQVGFLAEDVVKVLPSLVDLDKEGKPNSVDLMGLVPNLVKAIQEQQEEIKHIKAVNDNPCNAFNSFGQWILGCK